MAAFSRRFTFGIIGMIRVTLLDLSVLRAVAAAGAGFNGGLGRNLQTPGACTWQCRRLSGNGECNEPCNTEVCAYDGGDCLATETTPPVLASCGCEDRWLGNGICELFCNYRDCGFDGGDCSAEYPTNPPLVSSSSTSLEKSGCSCSSAWLGNGVCDHDCNIEECSFDHGDCELPAGTPFAVALSTTASPTVSLAAPPLRPRNEHDQSRSPARAPAPSSNAPGAAAGSAEEVGTSTSLRIQELQVTSFRVQNMESGSWQVTVSGPDDGGADASSETKSSKREDAEASDWTSHLLALLTVLFAFAAGVFSLLGLVVVLRIGHAEVHPWPEQRPQQAESNKKATPMPPAAGKSSDLPSTFGSAQEDLEQPR